MVPVSRHDVLSTCGSESRCVLANLIREIKQRDDDSETTDEVTNVSEGVENLRLLPSNGSGFSCNRQR